MQQISRVVFIEGLVQSDISLFMKRLNNYFRTEYDYEKIVSTERYESMPPRRRENARKFAYNAANRVRKEIDYWKLIKQHGLPFSFRALDLEMASPETRTFLSNLLFQTLPEGTNVPAEMLQAQFDYHNLIQDLGESHDLLTCTRGMMDYYVNIIKGMKRPDILTPFESLMLQTGQGQNPAWILQCPADLAQQRHKAATGEDKPLEYFEERQQSYQDAANSGIWKQVSFIDVSSEDPDAYRTIFASLALQMQK